MFSSLFQIAKNTFRESVREPIFLLVLLSALTLIGIYPIFTLFVFREQVKLVVDSAMATTMLFGWVAAVLSASHAIAREINNGTALLVLSKPVQRPIFILGKIAGILFALVVFWFLTSLATLIAVRIAKDQFWLDNRVLAIYFAALALSCAAGGVRNYVARSSFPMSAVLSMLVILPAAAVIIYFLPGKEGMQGPGAFAWHIVPALILILYSVWAMGTLATALSTRFELVPNLLLCSVVFVVGLMSDYVLGRHAEGSWLAATLYASIPNWQLFWMADALAAKTTVPIAYVLWGGAYISLFILLFLVLAVMMFWRREVGTQSLT
ncbi:MAG: hypothetical protein A3K19_15445 [Lentisphaerae bacterium RIFOXYB12_FULL_65_16]|nr:MAG: hypothetical protein A3K18_26500 [Lentisphaerae bacterium RIFOXYA12_64_32]OGV88494.1 MAG: hypothetical protein A3K19_15445 [Lentisphaerae bacterium RIFOXYB12_FULL_65_16]